MQEMQKQNCPLCEKPAEFEYSDHKNRKYFWCKTCTEFEITIDAESYLASTEVELRSQYSEKAKQFNENSFLVITRDTSARQDGIANVNLHDEFVLRSEL